MVDILARCPRHPIDFGVWPDPIHHWHYTDYAPTPWPSLNTRQRSLASHEVQAGAAELGRGHQKAMRSAKCKVFDMFLILRYVFPNKSPAASPSFIAWSRLNTLAHDPSTTTRCIQYTSFLRRSSGPRTPPVTHCLSFPLTNHSA